MKRILSALLLIATLCLALTGCGETDLDKSKSYVEQNQLTEATPRYSLSFCLVTDELLDTKALAGMQTAFNVYTEVNYKTHIEFVNVTAAEYAAYLASKMKAVEDAIAALDPDADEDSTEGGLGTGSQLESYPVLKDTQFDIFYIDSFDTLASMIDAGRVLELTDYLTSPTYRGIKNEMSESFLQATTLGGKYYAIPSCEVQGEYTYLIVDPAKAMEYNFTKDSITDWDSVETLRGYMTNDGVYTFTEDRYDVNAPIRLVKGQYADRLTYESAGKWCYVEEKPVMNQSDLFDSMLAISSYTVNADRAMKILYEIEVNRELHTILQYGILGTTYLLNNNELTLKTDSGLTYSVAKKYTGNAFSLYPCTDKNETATLIGYWKQQNKDVVLNKDIYTVTITASEGGKTSLSEVYRMTGGTIEMEATAEEGYTFSGWYNGETLLSSDSVFTFTVGTESVDLKATFTQNS